MQDLQRRCRPQRGPRPTAPDKAASVLAGRRHALVPESNAIQHHALTAGYGIEGGFKDQRPLAQRALTLADVTYDGETRSATIAPSTRPQAD